MMSAQVLSWVRGKATNYDVPLCVKNVFFHDASILSLKMHMTHLN